MSTFEILSIIIAAFIPVSVIIGFLISLKVEVEKLKVIVSELKDDILEIKDLCLKPK